MRNLAKKILILSLIFIILFGSISSVVLSAEPETSRWIARYAEETDGLLGSHTESIGEDVAYYGGGAVLYIIKLPFLITAKAIELILNAAASDSIFDQSVSAETILFSGTPGGIELTSVNFFEPGTGFVGVLRESVAGWYYAIRTIAIIASLAVLIYIAIRMAVSTIADDKAKYKRMLMDWLVSFAILFVLHYIILLVLNGNNVLVSMMKSAATRRYRTKCW